MAQTDANPEVAVCEPASDLEVEVTYDIHDDHIVQRITRGESVAIATRARHAQAAAEDEAPSGAWWKAYLAGEGLRPSEWRSGGRLRFIDLFCASGGLSKGFTEAAASLGFRTTAVLAMDRDERALKVYAKNHSPKNTSKEPVEDTVDFEMTAKFKTSVVSQGVADTGCPIATEDHGPPGGGSPTAPPPAEDLSTTDFLHGPTLLLEELIEYQGEIDVVLAGPPCQGHSSLNNQTRHEDARNKLYAYPAAIAIALGARIVIIENVPGVKRDSDNVFQKTEALLRNHGYAVEGILIRAEDLGWPQTRHRYFLIGVKGGVEGTAAKVVQALTQEARPVSWAIGDLLDTDDSGIMNQTPELSPENQRRVAWLHELGPDGEERYDLANSERPDCHRDKPHSYNSSYGRMRWDTPAGTLTTGFMTPGRGRFVHPLRPRVLTPREAARIQGFPDGYFPEVLPSGPTRRTDLAKWIGDAVPAPLGFAAALAAILQLPASG